MQSDDVTSAMITITQNEDGSFNFTSLFNFADDSEIESTISQVGLISVMDFFEEYVVGAFRRA